MRVKRRMMQGGKNARGKDDNSRRQRKYKEREELEGKRKDVNTGIERKEYSKEIIQKRGKRKDGRVIKIGKGKHRRGKR